MLRFRIRLANNALAGHARNLRPLLFWANTFVDLVLLNDQRAEVTLNTRVKWQAKVRGIARCSLSHPLTEDIFVLDNSIAYSAPWSLCHPSSLVAIRNTFTPQAINIFLKEASKELKNVSETEITLENIFTSTEDGVLFIYIFKSIFLYWMPIDEEHELIFVSK